MIFSVINLPIGVIEVKADSDTLAPLVNEISFASAEYNKGNTISLTIDVTEEGTGIESISVSFYGYKNNQFVDFSGSKQYDNAIYSGTYSIDIEIPQNTTAAEYYVGQIDVADQAGNTRCYWNGWNASGYDVDDNGSYVIDFDGKVEKCYINNGSTVNVLSSGDDVAPIVTSVDFDTNEVNKGGQATFTLNVEDESEIESVSLSFYGYNNSQMISPSISDSSYSINGSEISYSITISDDSPAGTFYLGQLDICDNQGNSRSYWNGWDEKGYSIDENGAFINDFTDNNYKVYITNASTFTVSSSGDDVAPTISLISLDSTQVIKPGIIKATISASDNARIKDIGVSMYTYVKGQLYSINGSLTNIDMESGNFELSIPVPTTTVCGEYYLGQIDINDYSGNSRCYWNGWKDDGYDTDSEGAYIADFDNSNEKLYIDNGDTALVQEEFEVGFEKALSNPNLIDSINNLSDGEMGKVLIDGDSIAEKEIFDAIKGRDVNIAFYKDNYQWIFNGLDINDTKDISLSIEFNKVSGVEYGLDRDALLISFADNGVLPGKAKIRIKSDYTYEIYQVNNDVELYYVDQNNELEYEEDSEIKYVPDGDEHWCWFEITHNSSYLATSSKGNSDGDKWTVNIDLDDGYFYGNSSYVGTLIKGNTIDDTRISYEVDGTSVQYTGLPIPEKDGVAFIGYTDGEGTFISPRGYQGSTTYYDYTPESDVSLTAVYTEKHTLTFHTEIGVFPNGEDTYSVDVADGDVLDFCDTPEEEGYNFLYWLDESNNPVYIYNLYNEPITSDMVLTAVMEPIPDYITFTFDGNGGYFNDDPEMTESVWDNIPQGSASYYFFEDPKCDGKAFAGWDADTDSDDTIYSSNQIGCEFTSDVDVTFTAVWKDAIYYNFYLHENDAEPFLVMTVPKGEPSNQYVSVPDSADPVVLTGWKSSVDGNLYSDFDITNNLVSNVSIDFVAEWEDAYTVTFYPNGGYFDGETTDVKPRVYKVGKNKKLTTYPYILKDGYQLNGYKIYGTDESANEILNSPITQNLEVEPDWIETVRVTFNANGGYFGFPGEESYYVDVPKGSSGRFRVDGIPKIDGDYAFAGWCIGSPDADPISDADLADYVVNDTLNLYASWTSSYYTLLFDANGGYIEHERQQFAEHTIKVAVGRQSDSVYVQKEGFTFRGWKVQEEGEDELYSEMSISSYKPQGTPRTIRIKAEWVEGGDYTFYLNSNYPSDISLREVVETYSHLDAFYGNIFTNIPRNVGSYILSGWGRSRDVKVGDPGYIPIDGSVALDSDGITFYAVWEKVCNVTIKANGGKFYNGPGDPGTDEDYVEAVGIGSSYKLQKHPIVLDGSKEVKGFNIEGDTSGKLYKINEFVTINGDTTFIPVWGEVSKTAKVTYLANGGFFANSSGASIGVEVSDIVSMDSYLRDGNKYKDFLNNRIKPIRAGYTFLGWSFGINNKYSTTKEVGSTYIRTNLTLRAYWKKNEESKTKTVTPKKTKYSNEWVDGLWYNEDGTQTYKGRMSWKNNSTGWWIEDTTGWYPKNQWQKIDGIWYFFKPDGYMASNEYYNGYWFNKDGSWDAQYYLTWKSNSKGWWVEDKSGWWPANKWLKIDGSWYYFNGSGYMATSQYVDGYWVGANGVCQ